MRPRSSQHDVSEALVAAEALLLGNPAAAAEQARQILSGSPNDANAFRLLGAALLWGITPSRARPMRGAMNSPFGNCWPTSARSRENLRTSWIVDPAAGLDPCAGESTRPVRLRDRKQMLRRPGWRPGFRLPGCTSPRCASRNAIRRVPGGARSRSRVFANEAKEKRAAGLQSMCMAGGALPSRRLVEGAEPNMVPCGCRMDAAKSSAAQARPWPPMARRWPSRSPASFCDHLVRPCRPNGDLFRRRCRGMEATIAAPGVSGDDRHPDRFSLAAFRRKDAYDTLRAFRANSAPLRLN